MSDADKQYVLPPTLVSRADLARLVRELEAVDNDLEAQRVRAQGNETNYRMPAMSQALSDLLELNKIDIAHGQTRMELKSKLQQLKDHAPVLHMTFAVEADPESLRWLAEWVRRELHPQALITVGLQPALVGGAYIRTPNHVHDFSLRARMADKRSIITQEIEKLQRTAR